MFYVGVWDCSSEHVVQKQGGGEGGGLGGEGELYHVNINSELIRDAFSQEQELYCKCKDMNGYFLRSILLLLYSILLFLKLISTATEAFL